MKNQPLIKDYMTRGPFQASPNSTLQNAVELMQRYNVRHLPVVKGEKLLGLITDRDLKTVRALGKTDFMTETVQTLLRHTPYQVSPEAPLAKVAMEMADRKIGSAVVMEKGKIAGIFTSIDALRALHDLLKKK